MARMWLGLVGLLGGVGLLMAAEYQGTIKSIDTKENKVVITINGADRTFEIPRSPTIITNEKGKGKDKDKAPAPNIAVLKPGLAVTIVTEKQGDAEIATTFKIGVGKKK